MKRKVFILCPVRNELANLKRVVPVWELIADHIILANQQSNDGTREYFYGRNNITIVENDSPEYSESNRNKILLEAARRISPNAIHLYLDADEVLSANVTHSPEWKAFRCEDAGTVGVFRWIQLWRTPHQYIHNGLMGPGPYNIGFIDDGREIEGTRTIHEQRGVGIKAPDKAFYFNDVVCLHYAWVTFEKAVRRNNWYKAYWVTQGAKGYHLNNRNHGWYEKVKESNLAPSPAIWLDSYLHNGFDVTSWQGDSIYWWDVDILKWFKEYGVDNFKWLDIWRDVNWEELRKLAIERGYEDVPEKPIDPPSRFVLAYHNFMADSLGYSGRTIKGGIRKLATMILP